MNAACIHLFLMISLIGMPGSGKTTVGGNSLVGSVRFFSIQTGPLKTVLAVPFGTIFSAKARTPFELSKKWSWTS